MLEIKISNIDIHSYEDFQKQNFDSTLLKIKSIPQENHGMAFDSALMDILVLFNDAQTQVAVGLFTNWLFDEIKKYKMSLSFGINDRTLLEEDLKSKEMLNKILEEELKTIKLKKRIEKEKTEI